MPPEDAGCPADPAYTKEQAERARCLAFLRVCAHDSWHKDRRGGHARQACYPIQRAWAMPEGRPAQPSPWLWVSVATVPGLCRTRAAPVAITTALVNPARAAARASPRQLSQRGRAQKGLFGLIFMISIMAESRLEAKRREVCSCAAETSGRAWPCGAGCGRLRGAHAATPPTSPL